MNAVDQLSTLYSGVLGGLLGIFLLLWVYRLYRTVGPSSDRIFLWTLGGHWFTRLLKIGFGLSMAIMIINVPYYLYIGAAFRSLVSPLLIHGLALVTVLLAGWEVVQSIRVSRSLLQKTYKKVGFTVIVLFMAPLSLYLAAYIPSMFQYPSSDECYTIALPVKERWLATHAGGSVVVNYHCQINAQCYAMDVVKLNEKGQFYEGSGDTITDFYTMGEPIYAPVDGIVKRVVDTLPNKKITFQPMDTAHPAGNHVVIEFEDDRYLFLAHLDSGSVQVRDSQHVKAGDFVGKAGNSGNTSWPHLHLHIQDKPTIDNRDANAYAYRFEQMQRRRWFRWSSVENGYLIRNDWFEPVP